jgi:hypothetical protein
MPDASKQETEDIVHPVRWMPSAWERIAEAAEVLTAREHRKTNPVDVIREGTLRFVDEILNAQPAKAS